MSVIGLIAGIINFEIFAIEENYSKEVFKEDAMESHKFKALSTKVCVWIMFISTILTLICLILKEIERMRSIITYRKNNTNNKEKYTKYNESIKDLK